MAPSNKYLYLNMFFMHYVTSEHLVSGHLLFGYLLSSHLFLESASATDHKSGMRMLILILPLLVDILFRTGRNASAD